MSWSNFALFDTFLNVEQQFMLVKLPKLCPFEGPANQAQPIQPFWPRKWARIAGPSKEDHGVVFLRDGPIIFQNKFSFGLFSLLEWLDMYSSAKPIQP